MSALRQAAALDLADQRHACAVALGGARGGEERLDDRLRGVDADLTGPEGKHVGVVVLTGVPGQCLRVAGGGQHARHLVGSHRRTDAGAVDDDAEVRAAAGDQRGYGMSEPRVVDRIPGVGAAVLDGVTQLPDVLDEDLLEIEAAVIGADGDAEVLHHGRMLPQKTKDRGK